MPQSPFFVGAGLPAMQAPRCLSNTKVMLSRASLLPHKLTRHKYCACYGARPLLQLFILV
ncbi:hypothetical protein FIV37_06985 [Pseudomonas gessardii]|nr:hypothetical protein [Pseudomonas gessardii]